MNVDRNELINFTKYRHFRSLPTLETTMMAFGIQKVYGKAFEKLAAFLKDLGGGLQVERSDTLQNLLEALASGKYFDEHKDRSEKKTIKISRNFDLKKLLIKST